MKPRPAQRCNTSPARIWYEAATHPRSRPPPLAASPDLAATVPRSRPACRPTGIPPAPRSAAPSRHAHTRPHNPALGHRRWWNPSDHGRPSSPAGSPHPAPCGQTAPDGPVNSQTPPPPTDYTAHSSASPPPARRTTPAGGSSRPYPSPSPPSPTSPPPPPPIRPTTRPAPAPRSRPAAASRGSPPGHRRRSCWMSPSRTHPDWPCPGTPRRPAADWR